MLESYGSLVIFSASSLTNDSLIDQNANMSEVNKTDFRDVKMWITLIHYTK